MKPNKKKTAITTQKKGIRWFLYNAFQCLVSFFFPIKLAVELKENKFYPSMSRREIKNVACAICKAATQNAK